MNDDPSLIGLEKNAVMSMNIYQAEETHLFVGAVHTIIQKLHLHIRQTCLGVNSTSPHPVLTLLLTTETYYLNGIHTLVKCWDECINVA